MRWTPFSEKEPEHGQMVMVYLPPDREGRHPAQIQIIEWNANTPRNPFTHWSVSWPPAPKDMPKIGQYAKSL